MGTSLLEARLLEDAVQGTRGKIIIRLPGEGYSARLRRMFVLSMAAARGDKVPAITLEHSENLADFLGRPGAPERVDATAARIGASPGG